MNNTDVAGKLAIIGEDIPAELRHKVLQMHTEMEKCKAILRHHLEDNMETNSNVLVHCLNHCLNSTKNARCV